ncbi:hypothetical protein [Oscillatoria sp. FACHB-1406]|nr:hypothetical protein [Oscillatoria sp. FACHB-1406]MBD2577632.1 hypothetical protein [Oscillatoria sp. FACHB-1406]
MKTEKQKMLAGELYLPRDRQLTEEPGFKALPFQGGFYAIVIKHQTLL